MRIHLEGMGLQGALLAHRLHQYGVNFTWHDIDATHTAWKASTGAIYPADSTNHGPDRETWKVWKAWEEAGQFEPEHLERSAGLVFCTKQPPHKGGYRFTEVCKDLRQGEEPSFHFNAQTFVPAMREKFHSCRLNVSPTQVSHYVITHGWGQRLDRTYWGWTRLVQLRSSEWYTAGKLRPAFYFRPNRYTMAYAYPVPGTPMYYAGSSIIQQRLGKLRDLEAAPKYEKWKETFEKLAQGKVTVAEEGAFLTGWRPAASPEDEVWVRKRGNKITLRPLWNSGIRHFPAQWQGIAPLLGLVP